MWLTKRRRGGGRRRLELEEEHDLSNTKPPLSFSPL